MVQVAVENAKGINQKGYPRPTILALSRQGVPNLPGSSKEGVSKGGYIVHGGEEKPDAIFMATGQSSAAHPAQPCTLDRSQEAQHAGSTACRTAVVDHCLLGCTAG